MRKEYIVLRKIIGKPPILWANRYFKIEKGPCVVVASVGRSGSTLLTDAIVSVLKDQNTIFDRIHPGWRLRYHMEDFRIPHIPGTAVKTHSLPIVCNPKNLHIFIFTSYSAIVASLDRQLKSAGHDWVHKHLGHLHSIDYNYESITDHDIIGYEKQLADWHSAQVPLICVKSHALWKKQPDIEEFLGLQLAFPEPREIKPLKRDLSENMRRLDDIYASYPDITII